MTKYRESKAAQTSKTYNRNEIEASTGNIYEALSIIAKRSQQINLDIKKELHEKLDEFATHNDSLEEIFIETPDTKRYLVLLQTADETLDYRYAEKYFSGAKTIIDQGGSHSFEDLESKIPEMLAHFC